MFVVSPWGPAQALDWAARAATKAGFAGTVVTCEPTGHRSKPLLDDFTVGFEYQEDARGFVAELRERWRSSRWSCTRTRRV